MSLATDELNGDGLPTAAGSRFGSAEAENKSAERVKIGLMIAF